MRLTVPFRCRGREGAVDVEVVPDDDPPHWGCDLLDPTLPADAALGYPVCTATVRYAAAGYAAVLGWVQLVRSTDGEEGPDVYTLDPTTVHRDLATPYAWFGVTPTLFDAPFRAERQPMTWRAHSYLGFSPDAVMTPQVHAVAGFSWGFDVRDGAVRIEPPAPLGPADWDADRVGLSRRLPGWRFAPGFAPGPAASGPAAPGPAAPGPAG